MNQEVTSAGLYRCTTCGTMIPLNAGDRVPACPTRCPEAIWTFFNERNPAGQGETREVTTEFAALDLDGDRHTIPAGARLLEVLLGPEQRPDLATFQFEGKIYFAAAELLTGHSVRQE